MRQFEVTTDSTCDLYRQELCDLDVDSGRLLYTMTDKDGNLTEHEDLFSEYAEYVRFFEQLSEGTVARTSILNVATHEALFFRAAKRGVKKLLHISISYGLSPTADNATAAIETVKKEFPDIDYRVVEADTATIGEGLLVRYACRLRDGGKTVDEAVAAVDDVKMKIQHFIVADDLMYLKRGGRVGTGQAVIGSMLRVKPIIVFDQSGRLVVWRKEMGATKAFVRILNEYEKHYTLNQEFPEVVIIHTNNEEAANELRKRFAERFGFAPEVRIMGPIIGAHVGPGAVAIGWFSNEQRPVVGE